MTSNSDKGEHGGFCTLLREVQGGHKPIDALLEHPEFKRRLRMLCSGLTRNWADAEELFYDVCVKVWNSVLDFEPDYRHYYGNFFAWLKLVARKTFLDEARRPKVEIVHQRAEDLLLVADPRVNIYEHVLNNERAAEFARRINTFPERQRLAIAYYVDGLSARETAEKLTEAGFPCNRRVVHKWVSDGLKEFFPQQTGKVLKPTGETLYQSLPTIAHVTAIMAKRAFGLLRQARSSLLHDLESEFDGLLASMQTAQSKRAVQTAFEASPSKLGRAAVKQTRKKG